MSNQNQDSKSLKDIIKECFNVDLPISGGKGNTLEEAIIIDSNNEIEGVSIEYAVVNYIMIILRKKGHLDLQSLSHKGDKKYDTLTYVFDDDPDRLHHFYFDISNFFGKIDHLPSLP